MSGITTTGSKIISKLENTQKDSIMESNTSMVGGLEKLLKAITLKPIMNVGGMQLFKISGKTLLKKFFLNQKK
ncbi:MAG: hypothetical protein CM1200mP13_06090 [Candidatus Pelagibacterales bacterium]|nr:MAG: hypothetical protein CM1200mP13_06090 [Pelagibacterales bacterium]